MPNGQPPLPRNWRQFPVGNITRIKREQRRMRVFYRDIDSWLQERIDQIPAVEISANAAGMTVNQYEYLIDLPELQAIVAELESRLDQLPEDELWAAVRAAYEAGTGDQVANLAAITSAYTADVLQVIQSDPWQRRVALIRARVFEELRGIEGDALVELRRTLSRGVEDGVNPLDLKKQVSERVGVNMSRAERLARTEITGAYRRARWDEDQDANQRLGIRTGLLWISGFLPDSRPHHLALNGEVVTQEFTRQFYSQAGNAVNCVCSQVSVLLNEDGSVATPGVVDKVKSGAKATGQSLANNRACACG